MIHLFIQVATCAVTWDENDLTRIGHEVSQVDLTEATVGSISRD